MNILLVLLNVYLVSDDVKQAWVIKKMGSHICAKIVVGKFADFFSFLKKKILVLIGNVNKHVIFSFQAQFNNVLYTCKTCHTKGQQVVVTPSEPSWLGYAKHAWSGYEFSVFCVQSLQCCLKILYLIGFRTS